MCDTKYMQPLPAVIRFFGSYCNLLRQCNHTLMNTTACWNLQWEAHPCQCLGISWSFSSCDPVSTSPPRLGTFSIPLGASHFPRHPVPRSPFPSQGCKSVCYTLCPNLPLSFFPLTGCLHLVSQTKSNPSLFVWAWTVNPSYTMMLLSRICSVLYVIAL